MRQRRIIVGCTHRSTITTITAGLAREVCETCGHVSLRYVDAAVHLRPDVGPTPAELDDVRIFEATVTVEAPVGPRRCRLCAQPAVFMIPDGLMCNEHAWQAAARLDWEAADPWVPIRIDRSKA